MLFSPLPTPHPEPSPPSLPPRFSQEDVAPEGGKVSRGDTVSPISPPTCLAKAVRWHVRGQGFRQNGEIRNAASQALPKAEFVHVQHRFAPTRAVKRGRPAAPSPHPVSRAWERNLHTRLHGKDLGKGERSLSLLVAAFSSPW